MGYGRGCVWTLVMIALMSTSLLLLASCSSETEGVLPGDVNYDSVLTGNGAIEGDGYFFANRTSDSVEVHFLEPFLFVPEVNLSSDLLPYKVSNVSEWGFVLTITGQGFWKDAHFSVLGNKAGDISFCRDSDRGNDTLKGGSTYSSEGVSHDRCFGDTYKFVVENYCDNNTRRSIALECEYNCYDRRGPAFCVDDNNVKEDCIDNSPDDNYFVKEFVSYNGRRYYDYCLTDASNQELVENTCSDGKLLEVNNFCEFGCSEGRCVFEEEVKDPTSMTLTFFAYANSTNIDDWVELRAVVTDRERMRRLFLLEANDTDRKQLTWETCNANTCNASWKVARYDSGVRSFILQALNFRNVTAEKNLTLNFSGDIFAPALTFNVTPYWNEVHNFTDVNSTVTDEKGIVYVAAYRRVSAAQWQLLQTKDCGSRSSCNLSFKFNSSVPGEVDYILKSVDINGNVAFEFTSAFYYHKNFSLDKDPPGVNFSASTNSTFAAIDVVFTFTATDENLHSVKFYKMEPLGDPEFISTLDCGSERQECTKEFTFKNSFPGDVTYFLNVTDLAGNHEQKNLTITYETLDNTSEADQEPPNVSLTVVNVEAGIENYTELSYTATDDSKITYMNVYTKNADGYDLLRTKFCFRQTTCTATYRHQRLQTNTTFLVVALDVKGNRAEFEQTYASGYD